MTYQIWSNPERSESSLFAVDGIDRDLEKQEYPYDGTKYLELVHEFQADSFQEAISENNRFFNYVLPKTSTHVKSAPK